MKQTIFKVLAAIMLFVGLAFGHHAMATTKTTDYESRFKLVFNVNGDGTLQVFDILGHELFRKELSTFHSPLSTFHFPFPRCLRVAVD